MKFNKREPFLDAWGEELKTDCLIQYLRENYVTNCGIIGVFLFLQ